MIQDIKKLLTETVIYGIGSMWSTIVSFLLTPILTRYLSVEGYGKLSVFNVGVILATNVFGFGLGSAAFNGLLHEANQKGRQKIQGTTWVLILFSTLLLFIAGGLFYALFASHFTHFFNLYIFILLLLTTTGGSITSIFYSILRAFRKTKEFSILSTLGGFATLFSMIFFVVSLRRNIAGVFEARIAASAFMLILGVYFAKGFYLRSFDTKEARKLLSFGLFLVPTGLLSWILDLSDRFLIQLYLSAKEVGLYTLGYQYASFAVYPMIAFQMAWPQMLVEYAKKEDGRVRVGKILGYYLLIVYCLTSTMILFSPEGIRILGGSEFQDSRAVVFPVTMGYVFFSIYLFGTSGIYLLKQTRMMPYIHLLGCMVNVTGNMIFIPRFGYVASAYTTFASYIIMAVLMWAVVYKVYPVSLQWEKLLLHLLFFAIFLTTALRLQQSDLWIKFTHVFLMTGCFIGSEIVLIKKQNALP